MSTNETFRLSRRGLMKGATGAVTAAPVAGLATLAPAEASSATSTLVTATVVRATPSASDARSLRVGIRAEIVTPGETRFQRVLVIEQVPFGKSAADVRRVIEAGIRQQVAQQLAAANHAINERDIAVQLFGGPLS